MQSYRHLFITLFLFGNIIGTQAIADISLTPAQFSQGKADSVSLQLSQPTDVSQLYLSPGGPIVQREWTLPHDGEEMVWRENMLYIAAGDGGVLTLDMNREQQYLRSRFSFGEAIHHIVISHDHAWVGASKGLYTADIRDPDSPRIRGFSNTPAAVSALTTNHTYTLAGSGQEVRLYDSKKPGALIALNTYRLNYPVNALVLDDTHLYIASTKSGIYRYIISADYQLIPDGHFQTTGPAMDIVVNNGTVVAATGTEGLSVLSATSRELTWLGSHQQAGNVRQLFQDMDNQQIMIINDQQQLMLFDISNPRLPEMISALQLDQPITSLQLQNQQALVLNGNKIQQIDFSYTTPRFSNEGLNFGQGVNYGGQRRVFIRDNTAYVADWFSGIHIYDISSPTKPRLLSTFHTNGSSKGIVVRDDYAYVGDDDHGLQIINIKNPRKPFRVAELATAGLAYIPVLDGDRLYMAGHRGGFQIIDISNVEQPRLLGEYDTPGKTWAIRVRDNIAYIADDDSGLMMFDVTQPDDIQLVGQFSPGGAAEDVILDGHVAYVAFFDRGVYVIDIKDPGYPKKLAHINTPGNARGLVRNGDNLYIADWLSGIQIYNVSKPSRPDFVGSYDTSGAAWGLAIEFPYAFVMDWWGGFTVLDISSSRRPQLAGRYNQRDRLYDIETRGKIAYVASGDGGLQIYDINNPLNPTWMTGVDFDKTAIDVTTHQDRAYVATNDRHIAIIDISDPFAAHVLREIKTPYPIASIQAQGDWLNVESINKGTTLYRVDSKYADKPKKKRHYKRARHARLVNNGQWLLIAQADYTMALYTPGEEKPRQQIELPGEILRPYQDMMITYSQETGISIINKDGDIISNLLTNMNIIDFQAMAATLYIIDDNQHLVTVDISQPEKLLLNSNYPLLSKVDKITTGPEALYFSGQATIVALKTLPEIEWKRISPTEYQLTNSPTLPLGDYNLHINNSQHYNALSIDIMKFSKPKFTMEDFKKALKKFKQQQ